MLLYVNRKNFARSWQHCRQGESGNFFFPPAARPAGWVWGDFPFKVVEQVLINILYFQSTKSCRSTEEFCSLFVYSRDLLCLFCYCDIGTGNNFLANGDLRVTCNYFFDPRWTTPLIIFNCHNCIYNLVCATADIWSRYYKGTAQKSYDLRRSKLPVSTNFHVMDMTWML
jgi:hypothetical protein